MLKSTQKCWCLSDRANGWVIVCRWLRNSLERASLCLRAWQFYKQILMRLPGGDCFPFHTAPYDYNLKWLVHIQFRAEHITEHQWQDALQLMLHRASWLHSFLFLRTPRGDVSSSGLHQAGSILCLCLVCRSFDCDATAQRARRNKPLTGPNIREKLV